MKIRKIKHRTMETAARHIAGAKKTADWFLRAPWIFPQADRRRKKRDARKVAKLYSGTQWPASVIDKLAARAAGLRPMKFNETRATFSPIVHGIDSPEVADAKNRAMTRMLKSLDTSSET